MNEEIKSLKSGMIWKTISTGLSALAGFLASIIFARFLGKDRYGELILVYTVAALFVMMSNFGLSAALKRFIPLYMERRDKEKFNRFILTSVGLGLSFTTLFSVLMFFLSNFISTVIFHRPSLTIYMRWGALYLFAFSVLSNIVFSIYYSFEKWREECLLNGMYLFSGLLAIFLALSYFKRGVVEVLKINVIASSIGVVAGICYILRCIKPLKISIKFAEFISQMKETLHFSTPLLMSGLLFYFVTQFDKVVLGIYRPPEELAQYYIAFAIATGIIMFVKVSETVLTPYLAKFTGSGETILKSKFQTLFNLYLHLSIVFSIFFYFLIDPIIRFAYGPDFGITAMALKIYLIIIVIRSFTTPVGLFLVNVSGNTFQVTKMSFLNVVMHLIFYFLLIPRYGYIGALAATIIARIVIWAYVIVFVKEINRLVPYRSILYAGIGMAIVLGANFIAGFCHFHNRFILSILLPLAYLSFVLLKGDIELKRIRDALRT